MKTMPLLSLILLLPAAGCAPEVVDVNAYLGDQPFPAPSRQVTVFVECHPGDQPMLLARGAARAVEAELDRRGYAVVEKPDEADYVLTCLIRVGGGRVVTQAVPRYADLYAAPCCAGGYGGWHRSRMYGYGYATPYVEESWREFDRQLHATLLDRPRFDSAPENARHQAIVWQATAVSTSTDRDLRAVLPYLLAGLFEHFGEDTGRLRHYQYTSHSDEVERFLNDHDRMETGRPAGKPVPQGGRPAGKPVPQGGRPAGKPVPQGKETGGEAGSTRKETGWKAGPTGRETGWKAGPTPEAGPTPAAGPTGKVTRWSDSWTSATECRPAPDKRQTVCRLVLDAARQSPFYRPLESADSPACPLHTPGKCIVCFQNSGWGPFAGAGVNRLTRERGKLP